VSKIVFDVTQKADGRYTAEALGNDIFTQADTWEDLRANVREAVAAYGFDQSDKPSPSVRLRLTRNKVLASPNHRNITCAAIGRAESTLHNRNLSPNLNPFRDKD